MKRIICTILILSISLLFESISLGEALRVGARTDVVGFSSYNTEKGVWSGFEIDLARQLAEDLKYDSVEFIAVDVHSRESKLKSGEVDCVIALYTITDARSDNLHFSPDYFTGSIRVLIEKSTMFKALRDLKGYTVGVITDTTAAQSLTTLFDSLNIATDYSESSFETGKAEVHFTDFMNMDDLIYALELGDIDAACADYSTLHGYLTQERQFLPGKYPPSKYGIATLPENPLNERIDQLISQYKEDGTLSSLITKWDLEEAE